MKFSISRDQLLKSLNYCQGVIEKRNTLPILSNIFFWGIVIRDICVLLGSIFILKREKTIKVSNIGKYTTVFLFVTICFYILSMNINLGILLNIFTYSSLLMYYFVALEYLYKQVLFSE